MVESLGGTADACQGSRALPAQQKSSPESARATETSDSVISACLPHPPNPECPARMGSAELRRGCFIRIPPI